MRKAKISIGLMVLFSLALGVAVAGLAQAAGGPPAGGPGGGGGGRFGGGFAAFRNMTPEQMHQMFMQRYKDALKATDQEWAIIEPKLTKVMDLSRQLRGNMRGMFGRRGRFGRRGGNAPQAGTPTTPPTAVEKATTDLQTTLNDPKATPTVIKEKLAALRAARDKVRQQLDKATADLKSILTIRQEAQLVMMSTIQ